MNTLLLLGLVAVLGQASEDYDALLKDTMWDSSADAGPPFWAKRQFALLPYCEAVHGVVPQKAQWETPGYEGTYETVIAFAERKVALCSKEQIQEAWRIPPERIRDGLRLVPARLQSDEKAFDIVYCAYEAQGRNVLLSYLGKGDFSQKGVSLSLKPEERELLRKADLKAAEAWANELIQSVLVPDRLAPYRLVLSRASGSDRIEVRGQQAFAGDVRVEDSDERPAHYFSALAGSLDEKALTVVMGWKRYLYNPHKGLYVNPPMSERLHSWKTVFDDAIKDPNLKAVHE